ncbi:allantoate amidohydrolase [Nakamurella leprariae]|uniref:Allantoate amidohydrolase n=1 Tax=Nakamurella leprariae TaxID=2803911 RepID=A0A938YE60_9ACTN|nr:allantoate amidohydrolase [Nakamurella leprariae]
MWSDLAGIGRDPLRGGYVRRSFTEPDHQLREWFTEQALRRGLDVESDRNGNLWAWWLPAPPGGAPTREQDQQAVVTGSHLDSVTGGGAFDGLLGVVSALLAVDELRSRGLRPRRPVALVCFAEADGSRFGVPCLGSRLLTGALDADTARRLHDGDGVSLADAAGRAGVDPKGMGPDPDRLARVGTFVELHIEQGRLLAAADPAAPVGLASEVAAHGRWHITVSGQHNHAGTTAAADRHDPMLPAAAAVLAARRAMETRSGSFATVGRMRPVPDASTAIAAAVGLTVDVRAEDAAGAAGLIDEITHVLRVEAELEGCAVTVHRDWLAERVLFDTALGLELGGLLDAPVVACSGAHDAAVLADRVPAAMLFVRNASGVCHAPEEHAEPADCVAGVQALADCLERLAG